METKSDTSILPNTSKLFSELLSKTSQIKETTEISWHYSDYISNSNCKLDNHPSKITKSSNYPLPIDTDMKTLLKYSSKDKLTKLIEVCRNNKLFQKKI